ncbi:membrane hypothetical protein [uncultured Gammaproteobacteria bacterium]
MRKLVVIALVALLGFMPFAASAQTQAQAPTAAKSDAVYPIVLAAGALVGVVVTNLWSSGLVGTLPLRVGYPITTGILSPAAAAASRIFVITSGVMGAWIASALYGK